MNAATVPSRTGTTDEFGWQESRTRFTKPFLFFIGLRKGAAYGLFFDNAYRSVFDFW